MTYAKVYKRPVDALVSSINKQSKAIIFNGDCNALLAKMPDESVDLIISSPPYCMGKEYEDNNDLQSFIVSHQLLLPELTPLPIE